MSTIKDVAEYTGLSIATISKYLNGGTVRKQNHTAIEEAIAALGYKVNPFARSLKTNKVMTIGVLLPTISSLFFGAMTLEIDKLLGERGYDCIIMSYDFSAAQERRKLLFLLNNRVDGVIYVPEHFDAAGLRAVVSGSALPIVFVDRLIPGYPADAVIVDNLNAVYQAVELLINRGHRRIAIIVGPETIFTAQERLTGYRRVMADYSLPLDERLILSGNYDLESGYRLFNTLMDLPEPPTAICITNYDMTLGAVTAAHDRGVSLPQDVDFIGYDCMEICSVMTPPLPVVIQPEQEMGKLAARYMLDRLDGLDAPPRLSRLKSKLTLY